MEQRSLLVAPEQCGQTEILPKAIVEGREASIHGGLLAAIGTAVPAKRKRELLQERPQPLSSMIAQLFHCP